MPKATVFFLHGMGTHQAGWSADTVALLEERAAALGNNWTLGPHELEYDSKFRDLLSAWSKNSKQIIADAQPANQDSLKELVGWLNKADSQESFAWYAAADVFLWRTSTLLRNVIINHLANQVAPVVAKVTAAQARNVHFVAHSLGTAVMHELLNALATGAWTPANGADVNGLGGTRWRPMAVHMVSNVSKLLELERNLAYESPVRPGPPGQATSYCQLYRNYGHKFDPIAQAGVFKPPWSTDRRYESYEPVRIRKVEEVHDLEHYVALPIVHVPMLESMFGRVSPDSGALDAIPAGFHMPKTTVENALRDKLEKMGSDASLFQTMRGVYEFFKDRE